MIDLIRGLLKNNNFRETSYVLLIGKDIIRQIDGQEQGRDPI